MLNNQGNRLWLAAIVLVYCTTTSMAGNCISVNSAVKEAMHIGTKEAESAGCPARTANGWCADARYRIKVTNKCNKPVKIFVDAGKKSSNSSISGLRSGEYTCRHIEDKCAGISVSEITNDGRIAEPEPKKGPSGRRKIPGDTPEDKVKTYVDGLKTRAYQCKAVPDAGAPCKDENERIASRCRTRVSAGFAACLRGRGDPQKDFERGYEQASAALGSMYPENSSNSRGDSSKIKTRMIDKKSASSRGCIGGQIWRYNNGDGYGCGCPDGQEYSTPLGGCGRWR